MCYAIRHVHDAGFVHLDIKPSNFLINQYKHVKLADFGLAVDLSKVKDMTDCDQAGDSTYMAPELMNSSLPLHKRLTKKCDIFSLGLSVL